MVGRIIETHDCVAEGAAFLAQIEPRFAAALAETGPLPLRRRADGFEALFGAIVSQQVSVAAADAIWRRLKDARLTGPRKVARASDEELRACGLSRQKIRYARELAGSGIRYPALRAVPTDEVVAQLVAVPGIGKWTAEIYAMFSLGRADVFETLHKVINGLHPGQERLKLAQAESTGPVALGLIRIGVCLEEQARKPLGHTRQGQVSYLGAAAAG